MFIGLAGESSSESDEDDDDDDDDDEEEDSEGGEETCPTGCDPSLYDKVLCLGSRKRMVKSYVMCCNSRRCKVLQSQGSTTIATTSGLCIKQLRKLHGA